MPVITSTDVLDDKDGTVTRVAHFKATDSGPAHEVREVCKEFAPCRVDFWQPDGSVITNVCSNGPSLGESDFLMTYAFEWRVSLFLMVVWSDRELMGSCSIRTFRRARMSIRRRCSSI